jgi:hypothetical protein
MDIELLEHVIIIGDNLDCEKNNWIKIDCPNSKENIYKIINILSQYLMNQPTLRENCEDEVNPLKDWRVMWNANNT